jgi:superfamily II DNA/RNA helicase
VLSLVCQRHHSYYNQTSLFLLLLLLLQVGQLHGDMTPLERAAVLDAARKGAFQLLLVSDMAARGLDMPQVCVGDELNAPLCYMSPEASRPQEGV